MTDSHFSDPRDRPSNRNRSSIRRSPSHNRSSSQHQSDRSSSQFHSRFSSSQSQRQQFEFNNKFFRFFQGAQNKFFIIDENFEYINDCLKQYTEKRIEDQTL